MLIIMIIIIIIVVVVVVVVVDLLFWLRAATRITDRAALQKALGLAIHQPRIQK